MGSVENESNIAEYGALSPDPQPGPLGVSVTKPSMPILIANPI